MKKNTMKRILSMALALAMSLTLCIPAFAVNKNDNTDTDEQALREINTSTTSQLATARLSALSLEDHIKTPSISRIRPLVDLAGNVYSLIECDPTGYLIYNNSSGIFTETALESPSPYLNYEGTLIYGGPLVYLVETEANDEYIHAITGELVHISPNASEICQELQDCLSMEAKSELQFGESEISTAARSGLNRASGERYVENYNYIRNLITANDMGYATDGNNGMCGWIASGIAMLYVQLNSGASLIDSGYLNSSRTKFKDGSFTRLLRSYGSYSTTVGLDLKDAIDAYARINRKPLNATLGFDGFDAIRSYIDTNHPVVVGGMFSNVQSSTGGAVFHYIVFYGYSPTEYICHYGWPNYNCVRLNRSTAIIMSGDTVLIELSYK